MKQNVVVDSSVLINFLHLKRLDIFGKLNFLVFWVPEHVVEEIKDPDQKKQLNEAFKNGWIRKTSITDIEEISLFALHTKTLGKGESACLAVAESRGWFIACDEKRKFRKEAQKRLGEGKIFTTAGLILLAIRKSILTVDEADSLKATLEKKRFKMNFSSFRDLL